MKVAKNSIYLIWFGCNSAAELGIDSYLIGIFYNKKKL